MCMDGYIACSSASARNRLRLLILVIVEAYGDGEMSVVRMLTWSHRRTLGKLH